MERMVWALVLMVGPEAALAEARFEWTETTSKECRAYFQQAYIDQARALPPKGMGRDYCGCVKDALATNPAAADDTQMCSMMVNSRFQTASQQVNTSDN